MKKQIDARRMTTSISAPGSTSPSRAGLRRRWTWAGVLSLLWMIPAGGEELIQLRNGLTLRGVPVDVATLDLGAFKSGPSGPAVSRPIWMVGDGLRRIYIHRAGMVQQEPVAVADLTQTLEFQVSTPLRSTEIQDLSRIGRASEFNSYGRRRIEIRDEKGKRLVVHQGIESVNARYAVVKALRADPMINWDMRIATSTLSTATLNRIFKKRLDQTDLDDRLRVLQFYIEAERYSAAHAELLRILKDFPDQERLRPQLIALTESQFTQLFKEAAFRASVGQEQFALDILQRFPLSKIGRITRLKVQDQIEKINRPLEDGRELMAKLRAILATQSEEIRADVTPLIDEISTHISAATLSRLSDVRRFIDSDQMPPGNKLSLTISGWILGSGSGEQNLKIARSLIQVRQLVRQYLRSTNRVERTQILEALSTLEGADPEYVSRMLPRMTPPLDFPPGAADPKILGMFRVGYDDGGLPRRDGSPSYVIQLPPEYDPNRSYPCLLALHPTASTAQGQVDWWAGPARPGIVRRTSTNPTQVVTPPVADADPDRLEQAMNGTGDGKTAVNAGDVRGIDDQGRNGEASNIGGPDPGPGPERADPETPKAPDVWGVRQGQASRNGYIVVAPNWTRAGQRYYEYTGREHRQILVALRDAMRRSSIDADRVFLVGHGEGGNAAWDLSLAHPSPWAGLLTISAEPRKTIQFYAKSGRNGADVPAYFLMGEKDGLPLRRNGAILQQYMTFRHDAMVVMYQGRGREFFFEDQPQMFDWMNLKSHRRRPTPREIEAVTMRKTDRTFWWVDMDEIQPSITVNPLLWDQVARKRAAEVSAVVGDDNLVRVTQVPSERFTAWLGPHMGVDMGAPITIRFRSHREVVEYDRSLEVMLEDVRTRGDRKRPYWAKIEMPQFN